MRTKSLAFLFSLLMLTALLPMGVSASPLTIVGSLTITGAGGAALTTQLVGIAMIANPGFEKNSTIQIPPFMLPVFVDGETEDEDVSASKSLKKNFDTTLVLTNTTGSSLTIELTLRDADGALLTPTPAVRTLAAHATKVIFVSDLLP